MKIINLTPHVLVLLVEDPEEGEIEGTLEVGPQATFRRFRKVAEIPPAGPVARARQWEEVVGSVPLEGTEIPVLRMKYGEPEGLPEPEEGTYYYVSLLTAQAAQAAGRTTTDLIFSGKSVRDRSGRIIGIISFAQL